MKERERVRRIWDEKFEEKCRKMKVKKEVNST